MPWELGNWMKNGIQWNKNIIMNGTLTWSPLEYMELDNEMGQNEMETLMKREQWVENNDTGSRHWKGWNGLPMGQWHRYGMGHNDNN